MGQGEKDRVSKEERQKKAKKRYETPHLVTYGSVTRLTDAKTPGGADGKNARIVAL